MPPTVYRTVRQGAEAELVIQKSRFIGRCFPVVSEEEALAKLQDIKKRYWDASHNCYAYSLGPDGALARFSDDGEPGGTAGMPMMEAIRNKGVTDLLVVVTRYFGGVLLGAGGLVRAYSRAASGAIEAAEPICMKLCLLFTLCIPYGRWGAIEPLLHRYGELTSVQFMEDVLVEALIPSDERDAFIKAVVERSDGRIEPGCVGERFGAFPII